MTNLVALPEGTELAGEYRIERVLGAGGFGITYLAEDKTLARRVTIKEYFPVDFAARNAAEEIVPRAADCEGDYTWGLDRFIAEAQTLARFDHPNIVRVYRYFRARNTGYIVLHFEEGGSLKSWLKSLGRAPRQQELDRIIAPLLDALELIHDADFLHRDIAPDNIMIRKDGSPVLIDFGSARGDIARHSKTLSALVKPGYSPYEQYGTASRQQGPWSDIYSLGATLYQAMTGKRPPDSPTRMVVDELVPVRDAALSSYRPQFLAAIDKALSLDIAARPQTIKAWRAQLQAPVEKPVKPRSSKMAPAPAPEAIAAGAAPAPAPAATFDQGPRLVAMGGEPSPQSDEPSKPRAGLGAAFLDGWRKAAPLAEAISAPKPVQPPAAPKPEPVAAPREPAAASVAKAPKAALAAANALVVTPQPAAPVPREAPRAQRPKLRWQRLAAQLAIGLGIATAAVVWQEKFPFPTVRSEGGSTVLSDTDSDNVPVGQLKGHRGPIGGVAFTGDGRFIVSTAADATIKVWGAASRALVRTLELDNGAASAMAVDGRRAATGHKDGTVVVWDLETAQKIASFRRSDTGITSVAFVGDTDRVAAASQDGIVALWDTKSPGQPAGTLDGHGSAVQAVAYTARGTHVATGGADKTVKLWNIDTPVVVRTYRGHNDAVSAIAFAPDGRTLASAALDGQIRLWSALSNRFLRSLNGHNGRVAALAFSPDGNVLASASEDGAIRLWDVKRGRTARTLHSHTGELRTIGFAPDGKRVAAAGNDGTVRLWAALVATAKPGT